MKSEIIVGDALAFAFKCLSKNFLFLLGLALIYPTLPSLIALVIPEPFHFLVLQLVASLVACGYWAIALALVDGKTPEYSLLFSKVSLFWKYLLASAMVTIAMFLGFLLLVVPGIILALRLGFFPAAMAENNLGPFDAIKQSWALSQGHMLKLLLLFLALLGICSGISLVVGLPFAFLEASVAGLCHVEVSIPQHVRFVVTMVLPICMIPMTLALAYVYRQLTAQQASVQT